MKNSSCRDSGACQDKHELGHHNLRCLPVLPASRQGLRSMAPCQRASRASSDAHRYVGAMRRARFDAGSVTYVASALLTYEGGPAELQQVRRV